jgi:COX assembly mitochondrial protein 1
MAMAAPIIPPPRSPQSTTFGDNDLRNPLPLSASQETEVRNLYYKRVRDKCAHVVKDFADCARGRTISVAWHCKEQQLAMNSCMLQYANKREQDLAREEWFESLRERTRKKEEDLRQVEERRAVVISMTRQQEEKERLEADKKKAEMDLTKAAGGKKKTGWFS